MTYTPTVDEARRCFIQYKAGIPTHRGEYEEGMAFNRMIDEVRREARRQAFRDAAKAQDFELQQSRLTLHTRVATEHFRNWLNRCADGVK